MESRKRFIFGVVKHLQQDLDSGLMTEDAQESIEVAIQCLQQAYEIDVTNDADVAKFTVQKPVLEIFNESCIELSSNQRHQPVSGEAARAALQQKQEGNDRMKVEDFPGAVECYSKAINLDSSNAVFYCNRAAAYTKLNRNEDAITDCQHAARLDPGYARAYGRMGLAYLNLGNYQKSIDNYEKALKLDPNTDSTTYQSNLKIAREKLTSSGSGAAAPAAGLPGMPNLAGLDFGSLLSNPAVMNMAQNFMQNPQMQQMFGNMMGGGASGGTDTAPPAQPQQPQTTNTGAQPNAANQSGSFSDIFQATQQFAQQMQEQNPELVEQLKSQFKQGDPNQGNGPNQ